MQPMLIGNPGYPVKVAELRGISQMAGNETLNNSLGLCRAEYIKAQLIKRAVPSNRIEIVSEGGIDDYSPNEANRNACVRLLAPPK